MSETTIKPTILPILSITILLIFTCSKEQTNQNDKNIHLKNDKIV